MFDIQFDENEKPMYERYWKLTRAPFSGNPSPETFFPAATHQAAWLKLRYLLDQRSGMAWLAGLPGVGKSTLLDLAKQETQSRGGSIASVLPSCSEPEELLRSLLADQATDDERASLNELPRDALWRCLDFVLTENTRGGRPTVLVIDDAELANPANFFPWLHQLLNLQRPGDCDFVVLGSGTLQVLGDFRRWEQLTNRTAFQCLIRPFEEQETTDYIEHRLNLAGATRSLFADDAVRAVHTLTEGIARRIDRLCDFALLVGFAENAVEVTAPLVHAVAREIDPFAKAA